MSGLPLGVGSPSLVRSSALLTVTNNSAVQSTVEVGPWSVLTIAGVARNGEGGLVSQSGWVRRFPLMGCSAVSYAGPGPVTVTYAPIDRVTRAVSASVEVMSGSVLTVEGLARDSRGGLAADVFVSTFSFGQILGLSL